MSKEIQYHGYKIIQTTTTTDVQRYAFGKPYQTVARLFRIEPVSYDKGGPARKDATIYPLITTLAAAREYIRENHR